ncbi:NAD(P)/FAD-dependent oxidoreductase [Paraburkholderia phenoliruptrix]|uniref:FAD-dependent pyridine nucleotide-disulfide oxidoreductase n=2 Tax=Paraburkholderia phenoliruptrix TaxID=252970 RepID=K0DMI8_9BURK|nr:FAD-dependent oxidoreductase [Paraburkholderia phenoliruptrix]AFT86110.1 FAD-dependent pyridine nucleotide-disulfide oxidoreductase [Paraburkholderia phenoliruptrix BR3459a]CAB4048658.1 Ferredoxin--NADP reductase [Paraburkholderia phenoliruptrix]
MSNAIEADVIVIGGGPSGIAAAVELRKRGVSKVAIIEREPVVGGVPRHCGHPPFGMREFGRVYTGPAYAERLARYAEEHGVQVYTGTTVVRMEPDARLQVVDARGRSTAAAERIILATGVRETPRSARLVSGDRPIGVFNTGALQAFVYLRNLVPFRRPLIVGTELVAISSVLTCMKAGIKPVGIIEENDRPTTYKPFAMLPRLCGIPVHYGTHLEEICGTKRVESVRIRMHDGSIRQVECDGVLFTGRFTPEATLVRNSHLVLDSGTKGPQVDQFGRCSDSTYYAAGNVLRPLETAGWSFREGRRIGNIVADDLAGIIPYTSNTTLIERADGIKLVMPQRLVLPMSMRGLEYLQVRVDHEAHGTLSLTAGGRPLWKKNISMLPERRLLIPLKQLEIPENTDTLRIAVQAQLS